MLGRNQFGQLGNADLKVVEIPKVIPDLEHENIIQAACGRNHTLFLTGLFLDLLTFFLCCVSVGEVRPFQGKSLLLRFFFISTMHQKTNIKLILIIFL